MGGQERHRIRKESEIRGILNDLATKTDRQHRFYRAPILNDRGYTSDGKRPNTDAIAKWMLEKDNENKVNQLLIGPDPEGEDPKFSRKGESIHDRKDAESPSAHESNRLEEAVAKELFLQHEPKAGTPFKGADGEQLRIVDYQVPVNRVVSDYHAKVDLVMRGDGETLIAELKGPESNETLLRTSVEVVTHYKRIVASDKKRFTDKVSALHRFVSNYGDGPLVPAVLFFPGTRPWREFFELMQPKRANLRKLLKGWGIRFFEVDIVEKPAATNDNAEQTDIKYEIREVLIGQKPTVMPSEITGAGDTSMEISLLELLRRQFERVVVASEPEGGRSFDFNGVNSPVKGRYYLRHYTLNLYDEMSGAVIKRFNEGRGNELEGKMAALRSSSAMTYNLFGNGPVTFGVGPVVPAGKYLVTYEHQLYTLGSSSVRANIDALLMGESDGRPVEVYVETKMCEWLLGKAGKLRRTYLDAKNYQIPREDAQVFVETFKALIPERQGRKDEYPSRFGRYDAFQMLRHLLAIYTEYWHRREKGEPLPGRAMLLNCVWEMAHPEELGEYEGLYLERLCQEHEEYGRFAEVARPVVELFNILDEGLAFTLGYVPFDKMAGWMDMGPERRAYLHRYAI